MTEFNNAKPQLLLHQLNSKFSFPLKYILFTVLHYIIYTHSSIQHSGSVYTLKVVKTMAVIPYALQCILVECLFCT